MLPAYITYCFGLNARGSCLLRVLNECSQFSTSFVCIFFSPLEGAVENAKDIKKLTITFNYAGHLQ